MKKNSNAAIARVLETDTKKLDRMVKSYEKTMNDAVSENGFLMAEGPMRAADAQEKLFTERKNKPEYEFVGYLLSHQDSEALQGFHSDLMREFLQTENYLSFALALCDIGRDADRPTDVYLFKLYMTNNFLKEYDYTITPVYDSLKRLGVKDDLIRCVLYEGSKAYRNFCGAYNRGPALWEQACRPVIFVAWKMMRPRWWAGWLCFSKLASAL